MNFLTINMQSEEETAARYSSHPITEKLLNSSPTIRKALPQTSILVTTGKVNKKKKLGLNDSSLLNNENDFEILTLPKNEKVVVSKRLYNLYNEILSLYPSLKVKKDQFEVSLKKYKYLYNDDFKKIKSIHDVSPNVKFLLLSKRPKVLKNEGSSYTTSSKQSFKSYQIIDFNNSIPETLTGKFIKKQPRILKSPEKILEIPVSYSQKIKLPHFEEKSLKILSKYKKPLSFPLISQKSPQKSPVAQQEILKIPAKLYYELMQVPLEANFPLNYSKRFQVHRP